MCQGAQHVDFSCRELDATLVSYGINKSTLRTLNTYGYAYNNAF
jgi:hypothetical protein